MQGWSRGRPLGAGHGCKEHVSPFKHYYSAGRAGNAKIAIKVTVEHPSLEGPLLAVAVVGALTWGAVGVSQLWGCPGCCFPTEPGHQDQLQPSLLW